MAFKIAINMPGAISAGAYTAGVLDFLIEALDAWYAAKKTGKPVPGHDVSIEAFTGASAGGMCAAISAILLQDQFEHIADTSQTNTSNRFYESWVNRIDISELLKTGDLETNSDSVISLLDSSIIEAIAAYAIERSQPLSVPRPYLSPQLTLFLSLTNLRGVPYSLNQVAPDSVEQTAMFFGDRIRFETSADATSPLRSPAAHRINLSATAADPGWQMLRTAAMATGAFPLFLAPRALDRSQQEFTPPIWESVAPKAESMPPPVSPTFPLGFPNPFTTLNVDGGVTNNDPYNYARDFLASLDPPVSNDTLPTAAEVVDRAVLTISPFPTEGTYAAEFDAVKQSSILWTLPRLFTALIAQSRFFGESLSKVMAGTSFSHFIVAPSDNELLDKYESNGLSKMPPALQCASLGAFGGFFERGFRAHDFALGRRNCQKFLKDYLVFPSTNPLIHAGLPTDDTARQEVLRLFGRPSPAGQAAGTWLPLVPLCNENVMAAIPPIPRFTMTQRKLDVTVSLILQRFRAVITVLLNPISSIPLRLFLKAGPPFITLLARGPLTKALIAQLGDSFEKK
jgi:predicted acylesterase/phospholipase RssA